MTRRSGPAAPALVCGTSLLAIVLGAALVSGPSTVGGTALPRPAAQPEAPVAAAGISGGFLPAPGAKPAATPTQPAAPPPPAAPAQPAGQRPGTIRLAQGGTATLVRKELGPDAVLPVPNGVREATWWGAGLDAAAGATVFAGHVNWRGQTGPFAELWKAETGDAVSVVDGAGKPWRYVVTEVVTVHKDDLPARAAELFGQEGPHRLVLVTCGGQWVGGKDGYESNRVVVATPR